MSQANRPHPQPATSLVASSLVTAPYTAVASEGFAEWLGERNIVVVTTTYESGRVIFFGVDAEGQMINTARTFERAMGLCLDRTQFHLSTLYQVWHFRNLLGPDQKLGDFDVVYSPRTSHVTGLLDIHDMAIEASGRVVFANTMYSCVATFEDGYSFRPVWKPSWIGALAPGDHCHLNGLGLRDGVARYITSVGRTDTKEGWRAGRVGGGVLWDIVEDRAVAEGLTMPHSPRWHEGRLYFINAGSGFLCEANPTTGEVTEICFCPGFARGLCLHGEYAFVGISARRQNRTFSDLPLDKNLQAHGGGTDRCAILVIHLSRGTIEHSISFTGSVNELYDIGVIPNARRANAIGFQKEDVLYSVTIAPE